MVNGDKHLSDPGLLDKIDRLFELGIGDDVELPQV